MPTKRTIARTKKRRQSKVFDLEEASTPTKKLKRFCDQKKFSVSSAKRGVTWSATVPPNKAKNKTPPLSTPPKKRSLAPTKPPAKEDPPEQVGLNASSVSTAIIPTNLPPYAVSDNGSKTSACSIVTPSSGGQVIVEITENRTIAIKSSRLAVDMAKSRACQADHALARARQREEQAKGMLIEASSERYLAEQEHENAQNDMKRAADYLLHLLQGVSTGETKFVAIASSSHDSGKPSRPDCSTDAPTIGIDCATSELQGNDDILVTEEKNDEEPTLKQSTANDGKEKTEKSEEHDIDTNKKRNRENEPSIEEKTTVAESVVASPKAKEEEPIIENVKDKRMFDTHQQRIGFYTGTGRKNNNNTGSCKFERHGEGVMITNGSEFIYRGDYVNNLRHGHGSDLNPKGHGYTGGWKEDQKHGFGSQRDSSCLSEGRWENDQRVGPHTYWFKSDGKAMLKNHINNRDLCGPSLTFSADRRTVKSFDDGVVEVVKKEAVAMYVEQMGASIPSPRELK